MYYPVRSYKTVRELNSLFLQPPTIASRVLFKMIVHLFLLLLNCQGANSMRNTFKWPIVANNPTHSELETALPKEDAADYDLVDFRQCSHAQIDFIITDLKIDIYQDVTNQRIAMIMTGPVDQWFGFGFGNHNMNRMYLVSIQKIQRNSLHNY